VKTATETSPHPRPLPSGHRERRKTGLDSEPPAVFEEAWNREAPLDDATASLARTLAEFGISFRSAGEARQEAQMEAISAFDAVHGNGAGGNIFVAFVAGAVLPMADRREQAKKPVKPSRDKPRMPKWLWWS